MDATLKCTDLLVLLFSNLNFKQVLVLRQRSVFSIDTIYVSEPIQFQTYCGIRIAVLFIMRFVNFDLSMVNRSV